MKKSRFFMLHPETNPGKIERLEALHQEYVAYVRDCTQAMLDSRRYTLNLAEKQTFFPPSTALTSQIEKNARDHAIQIVSAWAAGTYTRKIKVAITNLRRDGKLTDPEGDANALYTIGSKIICQPWKFITQGHIDTYNALVDAHGGDKPTIRDTIPMRLSEMTARLEDAQETVTVPLWLRVSSLEARKSIWLPLVGNPYVLGSDDVSRGILARKTKRERWRFEAVEKKEWTIPDSTPEAPRLGVDVGLNVLAATSDGVLYGSHVKPRFDRLYNRVKDVRANRQRQGLKENNVRLDRLESRLTGMMKTETGKIVNRLVNRHPGTVFVLEDLDLRGCRGQKRFAYRALQANLSSKAPTEVVNPAYTSQECPSCGHISRKNRNGVKFVCQACGRRAHADWVGAGGILRRSGDKGVTCADHPRDVKRKLEERFNLRWIGSLGSGWCLPSSSPSPLGRRLTTGGPVSQAPAQPQTRGLPISVGSEERSTPCTRGTRPKETENERINAFPK